ncbi:hypothetical protein KJ632_03250 [Patescibacteria group bacterium]|nr:hypothetical protein [Patescibacteria group bacterium]
METPKENQTLQEFEANLKNELLNIDLLASKQHLNNLGKIFNDTLSSGQNLTELARIFYEITDEMEFDSSTPRRLFNQILAILFYDTPNAADRSDDIIRSLHNEITRALKPKQSPDPTHQKEYYTAGHGVFIETSKGTIKGYGTRFIPKN